MNTSIDNSRSAVQAIERSRLSNFDKLVLENQARQTNPELMSPGLKHEIRSLANEEDTSEAFRFSRVPKRVLLFCAVLNILGLILIASSIIKINKGHMKHFWMYVLFAVLVLVPSSYYLVRCIRIGFMADKYERECMVASLPVLN